MQKDPLHFTPEEHTASATKAILQATQENGQKLEKAHRSIENASIDIQTTLNDTNTLLEHIDEKEYPTEMKVTLEGISVVTLKGDKGDKGDRGDDGLDSTVQGPQGIQGEKGDKGEAGIDGIDGKDGKDGRDGVDGIDGKDGLDGADGKNGKNGKDGSPDTPDEVVEKINKSAVKIDTKQVKGLQEVISEVDKIGRTPRSVGGGGTRKLKELPDVNITNPTDNQALTYDSATGKWVNETVSGSGGGHTIEDEGTPLTQRTNLNFVGSGVAVTDDAGNDATVVTVDGGSGVTRTVTVSSGSFTAGSSASTDYVYFIAGAHTASLPAAAGNTNRYTFKNNHSANITIDTVGAETVEGAASISIAPQESVDIISNGTNYFVT